MIRIENLPRSKLPNLKCHSNKQCKKNIFVNQYKRFGLLIDISEEEKGKVEEIFIQFTSYEIFLSLKATMSCVFFTV